MHRILGACAIIGAMGLASAVAGAQDMFIYPAKGQSQEQQDKDRYECNNWSIQQTGYDPARPSTSYAYTSQAPQGGLLKGAARGATVGVVGGAIAGDAGKGAAVGAASGALIGGMRRSDQARQQQYQAQQAANADAAMRNNYNRAMAACLQGRGYSVD